MRRFVFVFTFYLSNVLFMSFCTTSSKQKGFLTALFLVRKKCFIFIIYRGLWSEFHIGVEGAQIQLLTGPRPRGVLMSNFLGIQFLT